MVRGGSIAGESIGGFGVDAIAEMGDEASNHRISRRLGIVSHSR